MRLLQQGIEAPFHHGYIAVALTVGDKKIGVVVTHLSPHEPVRRFEEAVALSELARKLADDIDVVFLLGDLNQLSPHDAQAHGHDEMLHHMRTSSRVRSGHDLAVLRRKFLSPLDEIDYRPMRQLTQAAGLVDLGVVAADYAVEIKPSNGPAAMQVARTTVPTDFRPDMLHAFSMRLDYILCTPSILNISHKARFTTVVDEVTRTCSDHYPVEAELDFES